MSKKELQREVDNIGCMIENLLDRIHKVESWRGTVQHLIDTAVKPVRDNLAFNAKLMNLLTEFLEINFYEEPAQPSKIQIRKKEKVAINPGKRKSR